MSSDKKKSPQLQYSLSDGFSSQGTIFSDPDDIGSTIEFDSTSDLDCINTKVLDFKELVNETPFKGTRCRSLSYSSKPLSKAPPRKLKSKNGREISKEEFSPPWTKVDEKRKSRFFYENKGSRQSSLACGKSMSDNPGNYSTRVSIAIESRAF